MAVANVEPHFSQGAIEELLECAICRDRLNDPRVLSCQHYFCKKCLQGCTGHRGPKTTSLKCAICRKSTKLTFEGINALPANYAVKGLLEIAKQRKQIVTDKNLPNPADDQALQNGSAKEDNKNVTESSISQDELDHKISTKRASKKPGKSIGKDVARVVVKVTRDENRNFDAARRKNNLVMVQLCSSSELDTSNDTDSQDRASSDDESESDSSESTSDSSSETSSDSSDESSCSSLSDDSRSTSGRSTDESSDDDCLPSASMAFGEMNINSEVYVFSKARKPVRGKLVHVKGYGRQLFVGIDLEPGSRSWMKKECLEVRGTSLHQWWSQRKTARAIVHLDDCLPASVVEMMK